MVLLKKDVYEFVESVKGNWDTIIWDPPYLNDDSFNQKYDVEKERNAEWKSIEKIKHRVIIKQDYLQK